MFCLEESVNNVFRYNVSVSEKGGVMNPARIRTPMCTEIFS